MVLASVIFAVSKAAGGILFGIVFWIMSRKMNKNKALRHFLIIITIGFMLLFVSEQAVSLISLPIPPFGLASVATLGLSSYLILVGLYYSAISISTDIEFRKFIRASAIKELTFLGKIGSAEQEKETEKIVNRLINQNLKEFRSQIGNTQPENVKGYIDDIMDEIKRVKGKP
jgi:Ca2+/Na+ antiporter